MKTDKTRPFRFASSDILTAHHNHVDNKCDLPQKPKLLQGRRVKNRCYWWPTQHQWHVLGNICGCALCTGKHERRAERRRTRHNKGKEIQAQLD